MTVSPRSPSFFAFARIAVVALAVWTCAAVAAERTREQTPAERHTYYTGGVHNDLGCRPPERCIHKRKAGEPTDPIYPKWWVSTWTMYRVFKNYDQFPPPYASPPAGLTPDDYQVSYGATYYDSAYVPKDRDGEGAMMEYYDKYCLPIFPSANNFSCAFVSLGNKAYFLRYADRPAGTPQCCKFSPKNHPPRRDFIKHLPYDAARSAHLGGAIQAYAREVGPQKILFGYAFWRDATSDDPTNPDAVPYRHPQSFYFSGSPTDPPNAPIVSQNYSSFREQKPDPAHTWDQVAQMCPAEPEWCCLFESDCPNKREGLGDAQSTPAGASWSDMNPDVRR
ncbi:MAG: hypothetical protein E6Q50_02820 [Lysobacter sp.]|nr:MAG: hypothetical protein E6Q50_02820 [Lysobacter sp.]